MARPETKKRKARVEADTVGVKLTKAKISTSWRDDEKITRLRKKLRKFALEASDSFAESKRTVMDIQRARVKAKTVTHEDVSSRGQKRLVETIAQDKAHRSHIVGLQVQALDQVQYLKDALSLARRDIKARFGAQLKKEYGAITNQHDGIEDSFATAVRAVKEGELLIKIIDLIVTDIDKSQLSDKSLQKAADLIFHPSRSD